MKYLERVSVPSPYKSQNLDSISHISHGFGARGVDLAAYLDSKGIKDRFIHRTNQIHGNCVHYLMRPRKVGVLKGDAFITDRPGLVCFVRTADCVPILIADAKRPAVAAVHAGWRGTALQIVCETLRAMNASFGTNAADCLAAIGPRICGSCYEVKGDVIEAMSNLKLADSWRTCDTKVDLGEANRLLLERSGVLPINISILPQCTFCDNSFASYRRDKDENERQFNFIVIKGMSS